MTKQFNLRRLAALTAGMLVLPASAQAHVTLQPEEAEAGDFTRLSVRVPNERDNKGTEKVEVRLPDGFYFLSYEPVAGWDIKVRKQKLDEPVEGEGDEPITEQVSRVTFTAENKADVIGPGEFRDFGLSVRTPDQPDSTLTFRAIQTYEGGEVVRWIGPPDADEPAPQVKLTPAEEGAAQHGAPSVGTEPAANTGAAAESDDDDDDGPSEGLVIAALILGGLGLLTGVLALSRGRKAAT